METLQDEFKATRAASCGVLPLADSLGVLSTMIEVKTKKLTNALSQHDGEKVAKLSSDLATIGEQDQNGPARCDQRRQQTEGAKPVRHVNDEFTLRSAPGGGRFVVCLFWGLVEIEPVQFWRFPHRKSVTPLVFPAHCADCAVQRQVTPKLRFHRWTVQVPHSGGRVPTQIETTYEIARRGK